MKYLLMIVLILNESELEPVHSITIQSVAAIRKPMGILVLLTLQDLNPGLPELVSKKGDQFDRLSKIILL
jgi:hypothetical protein